MCSVLCVGLWNGSACARRGLMRNRLLYETLLEAAREFPVDGGTVSQQIEGGRQNRTFRSVESEVVSNALPVWIEFADTVERLQRFVPIVLEKLNGEGIVILTEGGLRNTARVESPNTYEKGLHLSIYTLERHRVSGKPVYQAVAELLRRKGILWVSTTRGLCGYGESRKIHRAGFVFRQQDVPIVMHVVDTEERLEAVLPDLGELLKGIARMTAAPVRLY